MASPFPLPRRTKRDGTKIKRNCHRPGGGCNHPCNRVPSLPFPRDPALQPLSFVFTFVPENPFACRARLSLLLSLSCEISSRGDISPPREKFKRGGNLRDSLSFPPPPPRPASPSPRGIRGERRKADRKFRSLWIKVFSKLPSPPSSPPSSSIFLQVASEGASRKRERRNFGRCFLYLSWC